jgi:hypothetical protein
MKRTSPQPEGWYPDDASVATSAGHPADRQCDLASQWRAMIRSGVWKPGDRLPVRRALMAETKAHPATIGKAMNLLIEEGFIVSKPRSGVHVALRLPHLHTVTMCFAKAPGELGYGRFHAALTKAAGPGLGQDGWADVVCRTGVHWRGPGAEQAVDDARLRRVAGIICIDPPFGFDRTSLLSGVVPYTGLNWGCLLYTSPSPRDH